MAAKGEHRATLPWRAKYVGPDGRQRSKSFRRWNCSSVTDAREIQGQWVWGTPKTKSSARTVDLPEFIIKPLAEHLLRRPPLLGQKDPRFEGLIFSGERGGPIRRHVFHVNLYDDTGRSVAQAISDVALAWPSGKPSDSLERRRRSDQRFRW